MTTATWAKIWLVWWQSLLISVGWSIINTSRNIFVLLVLWFGVFSLLLHAPWDETKIHKNQNKIFIGSFRLKLSGWHPPHADSTCGCRKNSSWTYRPKPSQLPLVATGTEAAYQICLTTFAGNHLSIAGSRSGPCWCHQIETFSALLALCEGIYRSSMDSPHKGQWRGALMFCFICARTNGWANNRDAGDLRHYDIIVMATIYSLLDLSPARGHPSSDPFLECPNLSNRMKTRTHSHAVPVPFARIDYLKHSIFHRTPVIWNNLPPEVAAAPSLHIFKSRLAELMLSLWQF